MHKKNLKNAKSLSLIARLAIALHCYEACCVAWRLKSPLISEFLDYMWEWPIMMTENHFSEWESKTTAIVDFGLGDELPPELNKLLISSGVSEEQFRYLTENTVEIIWSSFYGASDNEGSLKYLENVMTVASSLGYTPPSFNEFIESCFKDKHGWGNVLTSEQKDQWRNICGNYKSTSG